MHTSLTLVQILRWFSTQIPDQKNDDLMAVEAPEVLRFLGGLTVMLCGVVSNGRHERFSTGV